MAALICRSLLISLVVFASACGVVSPSNPYDPQTPRSQQARGGVSFEVELVDEPSMARLTLGALDVQLIDPDGQALSGSDGVAVRAQPTFTSDTRASFRFSDIVPGRWRISLGGLPSRFSGPVPPTVDVAPGQTVAAGLLRYVPSDTTVGPGRIFGEVVLKGSRAPAMVRLYRKDGERVISVAESPASGSGHTFDFTGLQTGRYAIVAESEGYTPDYALDLLIGDSGIAKLEYSLSNDSSLLLHPITAVLEPMLPHVEGGYYTAASSVTVKVLAFGSGNVSMRVSTDPSFTDARGEPQAFEPHAATKEVSLPDTEGTIAIHAQFEARSDAFTFVSRPISTTVIRDATPPEVVGLDAPGVLSVAGKRWVLESGAVVALDIDGFDAHSAVAGISVVVPADGAAPDPETLTFDIVSTPAGLVRLTRIAGLGAVDGPSVAWVTLRDRAGNVSTPTPLRFDVDAHDPELGVSVLEGTNGALSTRNVTLAFDESSVPMLPSGERDLPVAVQVGVKPLGLFAPQRPYSDAIAVSFEAVHGQVVTFVARFIDASGRTAEVETDAFTMNLSATLSGRVVVEGVPTLTADHAGTRVRLFAPESDPSVDPAFETTTTDGQGRYALGPVPEGAGYRLTFDRTGYEAQEVTVPTLVAGRAMPLSSATLRLERGALSGLFRLEDQGGPSGQHGGIVVIATLSNGRRYSATTVTDPSGAWRLDGLPTTAPTEEWRVEGQASGYRRALAGSVSLSANDERVLNPDAGGVAKPVVLTKISGDFDLCSRTGPCLPLAYTNMTQLRASLRSTQGVTRYRLLERTSFEADATLPAWTNFDAELPLLVDISGADGVVDVYLQLETADVAGPVMRTSVVLDTVPPPVEAFVLEPSPTALDPAFTNRSTVRVRVDAQAGAGAPLDGVRIAFGTDAPGAFRCEAGTACELPLPTSGTEITEGLYVLNAIACDLAGNCSTAPSSTSVIYDKTPPSVAHGVAVRAVSALLTKTGGITRSRSPRYDVEIDVGEVDLDGASVADVFGYRIGFDPALADATLQAFDTRPTAGTTRSLPGPALGPADGAFVVRVQLFDAAGNATALDVNPFELPIVLDTQPPGVSFSLAAGAGVTRTTTVPLTIGLSGADPATRVRLSTDGGRFDTSVELELPDAEATIELPAAAAPGGDGTYTVHARFYDAAGNVTERQASIRLDRLGPDIVLADCSSCRTSEGKHYTNSATQQVTLAVVATDASGRVDTLRFSVNGGASTEAAYTGTATVTLPSADGTSDLSIVAVDDAGNTSAQRTLRITLDRTSPVVSLSINAGAPRTRDSRVTLAITATDATSGVVGMRLSSTSVFTGIPAAFTPEAAWTLSTPETDGAKNVFVEITDAAGNVATKSATIVLDTTPPTGSIVVSGGAATTQNASVTATLTYSTDTSGYAVVSAGALDCTSATYTTASGTSANVNVTLLPAGDGSKLLTACFRDLAGNTSSASASILLDTTPPTGSIVIDAGAATTRSRSVVVTVSASADATQMAVAEGTLNCASASYVTLASSVALLLSADGERTVTGCLRDAAGNFAAFTDAILVDTVPPTLAQVTLRGPAHDGTRPDLTRSTTIELKATATGADEVLLSNEVDFIGSTWQPYQGDWVVWTLRPGDGAKTVHAKFRDLAGHTTDTVTGTIELDTTPPSSPSLLINAGATHTNSARLTLTLSAQGASHVRYTVDGTFDTDAWQTYTTSMTPTVTVNDGLVTVQAQFRDVAGNISPTVTAHITLDRVPPTLTSFAVTKNASGFTATQANVVELIASGADEMLIACDGTIDTEPWVAYAPVSTCVFDAAPGLKRVVARVRDRAGNAITTPASTVYLDNVAPASPVASSQSTTTSNPTFAVTLGVVSSDATVSGASPSQAFVYQVRGGQHKEWTDCGTSLAKLTWPQESTCSGPPFSFTLRANAENVLQVRARDRAGNASAESTTTVVHDDRAPGVVRHENADGSFSSWGDQGVDAGNRTITLTWEPPADADVAGYRVYYGYVRTNNKALYTGVFANEGASPLDVGRPCSTRANENDCRFTLTGIPNGTEVWVNIVAYDRTTVPAPNEGRLIGYGVSITPATLVPRVVGTLPIDDLGGTNMRARGLAVRNGVAYVATGGHGSLGQLHVVDVADPAHPSVAGSSAPILSGGHDVYLQGHYAYVADGTAGLRTFSLATPMVPVAVAQDAPQPAGWHAVSVTGREDLIVVAINRGGETTDGEVRFYTIAPGACLNTSGPGKPCLVGTYSGPAGTDRSYYNAVLVGNYLYLSNGGYSLTVLNVSNPSSPSLVTSLNAGERIYHVAASGNVLYAMGGLRVTAFDVTNPTSPVEFPRSSAALSYTGIQAVPYGGHVYVATHAGIEVLGNAASATGPALTRSGLVKIQYSDEALGAYNSPYTSRLQVDGNYGYFTRGNEGLSIVSLTRTRAIETIGTYNSPGSSGAEGGAISGHMWVTTLGQSKLEATYVNPAAPSAFTQSSVLASRIQIGQAGELFVVSEYGRIKGLRLTHEGFANHGNIQLTLTNINGVSVAWPYAYVSGQSSANPTGIVGTLKTVLLRPPYTEVASTPITPASQGRTGSSAIAEGRLYIANGKHPSGGYVEVYSLANASTPAWEGRIELGTGFTPSMVVAHARRLYVCGSEGIRILDLSQNPTSPNTLGVIDSFALRTCAVSGNYLFTGTTGALSVYDVSTPSAARLLAYQGADSRPAFIVPAGNQLLIVNDFRDAQFIEMR